MAIRTLAKGTLSTASLTAVFNNAIGVTGSISNAVLCNGSTSAISAEVYVCTPTVDTLVTVVKLPAGIGKSRIVPELIGGLNSQYSVKIKPSAATAINYVIYGETKNS